MLIMAPPNWNGENPKHLSKPNLKSKSWAQFLVSSIRRYFLNKFSSDNCWIVCSWLPCIGQRKPLPSMFLYFGVARFYKSAIENSIGKFHFFVAKVNEKNIEIQKLGENISSLWMEIILSPTWFLQSSIATSCCSFPLPLLLSGAGGQGDVYSC